MVEPRDNAVVLLAAVEYDGEITRGVSSPDLLPRRVRVRQSELKIHDADEQVEGVDPRCASSRHLISCILKATKLPEHSVQVEIYDSGEHTYVLIHPSSEKPRCTDSNLIERFGTRCPHLSDKKKTKKRKQTWRRPSP